MSAPQTHYELATFGPTGVSFSVSEGLGIVDNPIHYKTARGARNGRERLIGDGLLPITWQIVVLKITIEEIEDPVTEKPAIKGHKADLIAIDEVAFEPAETGGAS